MATGQKLISWGAIALVATVIAACSSGSTPTPDLPPTDPVVTAPIAPLPTGPMTAADITKALSERKFSYSSASRKGTITYYNDGTFAYQETGKGEGTGLWQASDGKLCEARNPTSFLPKGTPSVCSPITSDGSRMTVGSTQLIPL